MGHLKKKPGRTTNTKWHDRFVDALRKTRCVNQACAVAGVGRSTAYAHRKECPEFAEEWDGAVCANIEDLEASALRRAINGYPKEVFFQGDLCGQQQHYETALTIFLLKCLKPEKYNIDTSENAALSTDQTAAAVRAAIEAMKGTVPSK